MSIDGIEVKNKSFVRFKIGFEFCKATTINSQEVQYLIKKLQELGGIVGTVDFTYESQNGTSIKGEEIILKSIV